MSIGKKIILLLSASIMTFAFITLLLFHYSYYGYIHVREQYELKKDFETVDIILSKEEEYLTNLLLDWSIWDETYQFIENQNDTYIKSNLSDNAIENLDLQMMVFLDANATIIYKEKYAISDQTQTAILNKLLLKKENDTSLPSVLQNQLKSGILMADEKPFLILTVPVLSSLKESKSNGFLIFVKELDEDIFNLIKKIKAMEISFQPENQSGKNVLIQYMRQDGLLTASKTISGITGETIRLTVQEKEDYTNKAVFYYSVFILFYALLLIFLVIIILSFMNHQIIWRITHLSSFLQHVTATGDTSQKILDNGNDDISRLTSNMNHMLQKLHSSFLQIEKINERFRMMMEATNDGYFDFLVKNQEVYISQTFCDLIGYTAQDGKELYQEFLKSIHPDSLQEFNSLFCAVLNGDNEYFNLEYKLCAKDKTVLWVHQRGKIMERDFQNNAVRLIFSISDITERKKKDEYVHYLRSTDKLTELKNRTFIEQELEKLDQDPESQYFIIMADIDGLKQTNDTAGHFEGDKLIQRVAKIFLSNCKNGEICARWGGDEFLILLKDANENYIIQLLQKIQYQLHANFDSAISVSFGYAEKNRRSRKTDHPVILAENNMHHYKLMKKKSLRYSNISSLLQVISENNQEVAEHTERIEQMCFHVGKILGLSPAKQNELELLAFMHDIGKIGIPQSILMKPDKLTESEFEIMKTHTEIGYRIAKSTPDISYIANEILCHHEKYNGTGYPSGLKGEEIPLLSRIINVVDSFDVMTHKRVYKDAMELESAIEELKLCSGTQFDPLIVNIFIDYITTQKEDGQNNKVGQSANSF